MHRKDLKFGQMAATTFAFLKEFGFSLARTDVTAVWYESRGLEVVVYHGRQSYEIGFEVVREEIRYSLSELITLADSRVGRSYRNPVATTTNAVAIELERLKENVLTYATKALHNYSDVFSSLDTQRKIWAERLALRTEMSAVKPRADNAFREGNYRLAAQLYEQIRAGLSLVDLKKANVAQKKALTGLDCVHDPKH